MLFQKIWLGIALLFVQNFAEAAPHEPRMLRQPFVRVDSSLHSGHQPVIVFDLDDTLIDTHYRTFRILNEFLALAEIQEAFPEEAEKMQDLQLGEVRYLIDDTLKGRGVTTPEFAAAANAFWKPRFFSNDYSARDKATPGAPSYVRSLRDAGARIVYLTGRDAPSMKLGTFASLHTLNFPYEERDENTLLLMKPDPLMDDLTFKKAALEQIRALGEVVAIFENEPANLNMLHDAFPDAFSVFLDTIHSPKNIEPHVEAHWVRDFRY